MYEIESAKNSASVEPTLLVGCQAYFSWL